ncbi:MAG: DinB family protein [Planctomycetes bacterium]|nr:DinB family protein [Planctomycetota bacterium]
MKATDYIKTEMGMSMAWVSGLMADIADVPLTAPTPNGGNHPWWTIGHLVYSESNILRCYVLGEENPLVEWKDIFGIGSQPSADGAGYPPMSELLEKFESVRAETLAYVDSITDADLDKASHAPEESAEYFGTIGKCLAILTTHLAFHGGQIADARRAAGRGILVA